MSEYTNVKPLIYAALFAALTAIGAFIKIPIPISPVPITLQVFFVLLAGLMLGARGGGTSMIVYIILGIIGLPVFSGGTSGLGVLFGPTGGYLLGFIAGAFVIGLVYKITGSTRVGAIIAMVAGLIIIYLMGVIQLSSAAQISIQQAVTVGVLPFLIGDVIKIIAALIVADRIRPLIDVS
ncbi:MAG TPA: biotin transporter BioY [Candidatus Nanoarchaeia archaeon]|nr:biotin transporter BioY [Candidatus Nanoarchaeia archaeon]